MHNLIYLSAASYLYSDNELIAILEKSRLNNTALDVTGLLLYHEGSIIQVLEGEKDTIFALYHKIKGDNRHKRIIKMVDSVISERSFGEWSMGFKQLTNHDWSALTGYLNFDDQQTLHHIAASRSAQVVTMIQAFASVNNL